VTEHPGGRPGAQHLDVVDAVPTASRPCTTVRVAHSVSPHRLRPFLLSWLKAQGIDDALIQPYSGHEYRRSLEVYSGLSLADAQQRHDEVIDRDPV
jgi:integrase/recombinase XerD